MVLNWSLEYFLNIQRITSGFVAKTKIATNLVMLKKLFPFEVDFYHKGLFGKYLSILWFEELRCKSRYAPKSKLGWIWVGTKDIHSAGSLNQKINANNDITGQNTNKKIKLFCRKRYKPLDFVRKKRYIRDCPIRKPDRVTWPERNSSVKFKWS